MSALTTTTTMITAAAAATTSAAVVRRGIRQHGCRACFSSWSTLSSSPTKTCSGSLLRRQQQQDHHDQQLQHEQQQFRQQKVLQLQQQRLQSQLLNHRKRMYPVGVLSGKVNDKLEMYGHKRSNSSRYNYSTSALVSASKDDGNNNDENNKIWLEELEAMKEERDALFGFTDEDRAAWSSSASSGGLSSDLMQEIEEARQQQQQQQQTPQDSFLDFDNDDDFDERYNLPPKAVVTPSSSTSTTQSAAADKYHDSGLSHVSSDGTSVHMVDITDKESTARVAVARAVVTFPLEVAQALTTTSPSELTGPKGPIFQTAKVAGIMAAKKTSDLIPLCHPLPLNKVHIEIHYDAVKQQAVVQCECRVTHKTGVEMEALVGASVAALTIYDMTKALSHDIVLSETRLLKKSGGKRMVNHQQDQK